MKRATLVMIWRGAALACCLAVLLMADVRRAPAALQGSMHDFSTLGPYSQSLGQNGTCSACHLPHSVTDPIPPYLLLWRRTMRQEFDYFKYDGSRNNPNYVPDTTMFCYDCHDDNATTSPPAVDNEPPNGTGTWQSGREPQDVAFTDDTLKDDPLAIKPGFYELMNGDVPGGATALPTAGDPTGGHYWQSDPSGTPDYQRGDKVPCSLCHDPHNTRTGTNEAFFLTSTTFPGGDSRALGNGLDASNKNDTKNPNRSRNGTGTGRQMCAACHGYSNSTPLSFGWGDLPSPPKTLTQHHSDNLTPCTRCHPHNKVYTSCSECHGFPPLRTYAQAGNHYFDRVLYPDVENYQGGAGAHQRHKDALGDAIFQCEICHGPDAGSADWHNFGNGVFPPPTDANPGKNVDIMGQSKYWDPDNSRTNAVYTGNPSSEVIPPGEEYEFKFKGGDDRRCANFACHGDPPDNVGDLTWTSDMVDGDTPPVNDNPNAGDIRICKWCHDGTPAVIGTGAGAIVAPNVMGNGSTWGAEVNGHGLAASTKYDRDEVGENPKLGKNGAGKDCTVCHDARYQDNGAPPPPAPANVPYKTHFDTANDSAEKRLWSGATHLINGQTISATPAAAPDEMCVACHQNTGTDAGTQVSSHGNDFEGNAELPRASMTRACRQCHDVHGANWNNATTPPRNLYMVGRWVDANNNGLADDAVNEAARVDSNAVNSTADVTKDDLPVVLARRGTPTTASADDSFDDGFDDGQHESVCVVCHKSADMNPIHKNSSNDLIAQNTVESETSQGLGHNPVGTDCMACHDHDYDNVAGTADAFAPSGCNGCHGTNASEAIRVDPFSGLNSLRGQFWPDGGSPFAQYDYADNQTGAHRKHVESIAQRLYEEGADQVVLDYSAANGTLTSAEKQKTICAFCHPNPGGAGHSTDDDLAGSPDGRVNVYGGTAVLGWLRKYVPNAGSRAAYADNTELPPNGYDFTTASCANLVCHNQAATPVAATWDAAPGWNDPPGWSASATCSATTCHATGTYTNAHAIHVGTAQKNYACTECHANNGLGHGNGEIDMVWNNAASIEGSVGADDGFYDKNDPGDTGFGYKSGSYAVTCNLVYCHGGDNAAWGGGDITPVWDNSAPDSVYCGSCHDGNGTPAAAGDASVIATGNHTAHLNGSYGPRFADPAGIAGPTATMAASCVGTATIGCHTAFDVPTITPTHVNGSKEFANIVTTTATFSVLGATAPAGAPDAASTDRCNNCHSTAEVTVNIPGPATVTRAGAVLAKVNWADGAYKLPCLTCHNGTVAATVFADGSDGPGNLDAAPDMLGDDTNYGAEIRGHNRSLAEGGTGTYPESDNVAAAKDCTACHDAVSAHINGSNDTTYAGNRMLATVNGIAANTATAACNACHATDSGTPASTKTRHINMHGNTGFPTSPTRRLEEAFPATSGTYAMECSNCHEPHGRTANGTGYNIYMVPSEIKIPASTAKPPATGVRFEARTGYYSYDDDDTAPADAPDLCFVCHDSTNNAMEYNEGGDHAAPQYDNDERGSDCSGCHVHNRDDNVATVDGFMTVACNTCHTFPGLASLAAVPPNTQAPHLLSASHDKHIGRPSDRTALANKGFVCNACHYQSSHNNARRKPTDAWGTITAAQVQVRFANPAAVPAPPQLAGPWNPVAAANNPVDRTLDSTSFAGGVCSDLYCHGDDATTFPADDAGTITKPTWGDPASAVCGTCHKVTDQPNAGDPPPASLAHLKHAGSATTPEDPEYSIGCPVCHYTTTTDGAAIVSMSLHVNHSADVAFNTVSEPRVDANSDYAGDSVVGSGYGACTATYCHSNGADRVAPFTEVAAASLAWNAGESQCGNCHGDGAANGMPGYADGSPKANKHSLHNAVNGYGCQVCHWPTTHTDGSTIFTIANHVNGSYEAGDDGAGSPLDEFDYNPAAPGVAGTCDNANCHGGNDGISWGSGTITCDLCHSYVGGARTPTDVNNFAWDGTIQSKIGNAAGGQYETAGHGKPGVGVACAGCHNSTLPHDRTMIGTNPYRLDGYTPAAGQSDFCNTTCHTVQVRTHDPAEMKAAGIEPKRVVAGVWPAPWNSTTTSPRCVNCHDPHGDGTNLAMINGELYDKSAFQTDAVTPATPTEQTNLVFTNNTASPFIATSAPYNTYADSVVFSSICQECHEDASMVSFHDGPSGGTTFGANHPNIGTTDCSDCHRHDAGFAPSGCEGCHNIDSTYPLAPNVMGDGDNPDGTGGTKKPYDNGTWGYNVNGHGSNGTAVNTPVYIDPNDGSRSPYLTPDLKCTDCHDIASPSTGDGRHLNGILNSVEGKLNPSENTAHLRTEAICVPPYNASPFSGPCYSFIDDTGTGGEANVQVKFDKACWLNCHQKINSFPDMRHAQDLILAPAVDHENNFNNYPNAVHFGDKGSVANGESIAYPIDSALTTLAGTGGDDFAPCIACHNPHGTPVVESLRNTNRMMRAAWAAEPSAFCKVCHQ